MEPGLSLIRRFYGANDSIPSADGPNIPDCPNIPNAYAARAYSVMIQTRSQTIGYSLTDSPVGLAAFIYDYNNGEPERFLTKDQVLDDIALYWLTNTGTGAQPPFGRRAEDQRDFAAGGHHGLSGRALSSTRNVGSAHFSGPRLLP